MSKHKFPHKHDDLGIYAANWLRKSCNFKIAIANVRSSSVNEQPDVFAINSYGTSVVIEVKTSRADFLRDKHKPFRKDANGLGMGDYRLYCCLEGVVLSISELPRGWGLIELSGVTKPQFKIIHGTKPNSQKPNEFVKNAEEEQKLLIAMLNRVQVEGHDLQQYADASVWNA